MKEDPNARAEDDRGCAGCVGGVPRSRGGRGSGAHGSAGANCGPRAARRSSLSPSVGGSRSRGGELVHESTRGCLRCGLCFGAQSGVDPLVDGFARGAAITTVYTNMLLAFAHRHPTPFPTPRRRFLRAASAAPPRLAGRAFRRGSAPAGAAPGVAAASGERPSPLLRLPARLRRRAGHVIAGATRAARSSPRAASRARPEAPAAGAWRRRRARRAEAGEGGARGRARRRRCTAAAAGAPVRRRARRRRRRRRWVRRRRRRHTAARQILRAETSPRRDHRRRPPTPPPGGRRCREDAAGATAARGARRCGGGHRRVAAARVAAGGTGATRGSPSMAETLEGRRPASARAAPARASTATVTPPAAASRSCMVFHDGRVAGLAPPRLAGSAAMARRRASLRATRPAAARS